MNVRPSIPGLLSFLPFVGFLWLMSYTYLAYLHAGYWPPLYGRPDPTSWAAGHALMGGLLVLMIIAPLALPVMLWMSSRRVFRAPTSQERTRKLWALVREVSVFALGAVLFVTELLRHSEWLLD